MAINTAAYPARRDQFPENAIARSAATLMADPVLRVLVLAMALAHLLDVFTTAAALQLGIPEMNPLSAGLIGRYGIGGLLVEKLAVMGITAYNMGALPRRWAISAGILTTLVTAAAVVWNIHLGA